MKGNYIAKHMDSVNRNAVHKTEVDYQRNFQEQVQEGLVEYFDTKEEERREEDVKS